MKKHLSLIFLIHQFVFSQNVTINCRFASPQPDSCSIRIDKFHILFYEPLIKNIIVNNQCVFQFNIVSPCVVDFNYNKQSISLWIEPNNNLKLSVDNDSLYKAVTVENSAENAFLKSFYFLFKNDFDKDVMKKKILSTGIDIFENEIYNQRKKQNEFLNNYKDKQKFTAAFNSYITNLIKYNYYYLLQAYPIINANENKGLVVKPLPAVLLDNVNDKLANNDSALNTSAYCDFLNYYVIYNTSKLNGFNKFTDNSTSMEKKMSFVNQSIQGKANVYFIANYLDENVDKVSPFTAKHIYGMLEFNDKSGEYSKLLKPKCEKQMKMKVKDEKLESASNASQTGASNNVKILGSDGKYFTLEDFKGKVVYVDYWASWCGPCRGQFPFSKELHKKFTPKQLKKVVFLYISIDKTQEIWKNAIEQNGLGEFENGLVPGDWGSDIVKYFQINSIPRYMLIDKKGNIVNLNAPRPSEESIFDDIIKLIDE